MNNVMSDRISDLLPIQVSRIIKSAFAGVIKTVDIEWKHAHDWKGLADLFERVGSAMDEVTDNPAGTYHAIIVAAFHPDVTIAKKFHMARVSKGLVNEEDFEFIRAYCAELGFYDWCFYTLISELIYS